MAETLGSLVDKLSIKNLRLWHLDEMLETMDDTDPKINNLKAKKDLVLQQQQALADEIDDFLVAAIDGRVKIRDEKLKLYQNKNVASTDGMKSIGQAISELSIRNIRCWHLEDQVRRTDLPDTEIVGFKRKIDTTNQERNDFMDKVDDILAQETKRKN